MVPDAFSRMTGMVWYGAEGGASLVFSVLWVPLVAPRGLLSETRVAWGAVLAFLGFWPTHPTH